MLPINLIKWEAFPVNLINYFLRYYLSILGILIIDIDVSTDSQPSDSIGLATVLVVHYISCDYNSKACCVNSSSSRLQTSRKRESVDLTYRLNYKLCSVYFERCVSDCEFS